MATREVMWGLTNLVKQELAGTPKNLMIFVLLG